MALQNLKHPFCFSPVPENPKKESSTPLKFQQVLRLDLAIGIQTQKHQEEELIMKV